MMENLSHYYHVLHLSPGASRSAIRAAYRQLAKEYHPDRGGLPEQMVQLNEAYAVLIKSDTFTHGPFPDEVGHTSVSQSGEEPAAPFGFTASRRLQALMRSGSRTIDTLIEVTLGLLLLRLLLSLLLSFGVHPNTARDIAALSPFLLPFLYLMLWMYLVSFSVLFETILLAVWGSTPGHWLLNSLVFDLTQDRITFGRALRRCLSVWAFGLGLGLPFLVLFTLYWSYQRLIKRGNTLWDEAGDFFVAYLGLIPCRIAAGLLLLLLLFPALHLLLGYLHGLWW